MASRTTSLVLQRIAVAVALALAVVGCGSNDPSSVGSSDRTGASSAPSAASELPHNDADIAFVRDMVPHHEGAVSMSELAETRAQSADVKDLAARIAAAQEPEIERMRELADGWGADLDAGGHGGHGEHGDDSAALEDLSGAAFDRAFLTSMIEHHEGALPMSRQVLAEGDSPEAKELAQEIISVQEKEIAEMQELLAQL